MYIVFLLLRCDSFLDVNPDSEVVNDDMFNSASGVEDALYGVYMTMVTKDMYGRLMSTTIPEILAQNFTSTYQYLPYLGRFEYGVKREICIRISGRPVIWRLVI